MSGKHRGAAHEEHMDETWLIPYADLLTLLLALFIVLYASSNIDIEKFNAMREAFYKEIMNPGGFSQAPTDILPPDTFPPEENTLEQEQLDLKMLQAEINRYLDEKHLENQVSTTIDDRGLIISVNDAVLFDPGMAAVKQEYRPVMIQIGEIVSRLDNFIRVEGHTDTVPIGSAAFPSNWELAGGRAASIVRLFISESHIRPEKLMAVGYGEFRPVADNETAEGRGRNRRVDIIILSSYFNVLENQRIGN